MTPAHNAYSIKLFDVITNLKEIENQFQFWLNGEVSMTHLNVRDLIDDAAFLDSFDECISSLRRSRN